ncbi:MAG: hypothetical protein V8Q54_04625 [Alistipes senegalensis]
MTVYGERYEASLKNRTVTGAYFAGTSATVTLGNSCPKDWSDRNSPTSRRSGSPDPLLRSAARRLQADRRVRRCGRRHLIPLRLPPFGNHRRPLLQPGGDDRQLRPGGLPGTDSRGGGLPRHLVLDRAGRFGIRPEYSGGLGTYTMKHIPMAVYAPAVGRTFFVYGGTPAAGRKYLLCTVGCYDHKTGLLQQPRRRARQGRGRGFRSARRPDGPDRPERLRLGFRRRARQQPPGHPLPERESLRHLGIRLRINESVMAYPQVHYHPDGGFFLFFTRYDGVRRLF